MINLNAGHLEEQLLGGITIMVLSEVNVQLPFDAISHMNEYYFENFDDMYSDWKDQYNESPAHPVDYLMELSTYIASRLLEFLGVCRPAETMGRALH